MNRSISTNRVARVVPRTPLAMSICAAIAAVMTAASRLVAAGDVLPGTSCAACAQLCSSDPPVLAETELNKLVARSQRATSPSVEPAPHLSLGTPS